MGRPNNGGSSSPLSPPHTGNFLNDLYRYDLGSNYWLDLSNQNIVGALPSARMGPGLAACDQALYLYGGNNETGDDTIAQKRMQLICLDFTREHSCIVSDSTYTHAFCDPHTHCTKPRLLEERPV